MSFSSRGQFFVAGDGVWSSYSGTAGSWTQLPTSAPATFSAACASDSLLVFGARGGTREAPSFVSQSALIFVGPPEGPFYAITSFPAAWGNGATTGRVTACARGAGIFVVAINTASGNVLLTSADGATWSPRFIPSTFFLAETEILSLTRTSMRWLVSGLTRNNRPVVSYSAASPSFQWADSANWATGTLFQEKQGLASSGSVSVIGRRTFSGAAEFAFSSSNPPSSWASASASPSLDLTSQVQQTNFDPLTSQFYSAVANSTRCKVRVPFHPPPFAYFSVCSFIKAPRMDRHGQS